MERGAKPERPGSQDVPQCERHGARTRLTCVDCGAPICPKCMVRTDVGLKCERDAEAVSAPAVGQSRRVWVAVGALVAGVVALVVAALVIGGVFGEESPPAEEAGPVVGSWSEAPALGSVRGSTHALSLPDGRVLVAGGGVGSAVLPATEIFDAESEEWNTSGEMNQARRGHEAVVLEEGRVLVAGGLAESELLASAEVFDPEEGEWEDVGAMTQPRLGHTMTRLPDGRVLAAGGTGQTGTASDGGQTVRPEASAELFDPESGEWAQVGEMLNARFEATATPLDDGRVLIAGGRGPKGDDVGPLSAAELYDPATENFSRTGTMNDERSNHAATALADGRVLISGGDGGDTSIASAEVYNPSRGAWARVDGLAEGRRGHTATLLEEGDVLVAGGEDVTGGRRTSLSSAERYDTEAGEWVSASEMSCARSEQGAARLPDGSVLVAAGDAAFPGEPPQAQSCVDRYGP